MRIHIDEKISRDDITLLEIETQRINSTQGERGTAWEQESCLWFAYDAYGYGYTFHVNQIRDMDAALINSTVLPGTCKYFKSDGKDKQKKFLQNQMK